MKNYFCAVCICLILTGCSILKENNLTTDIHHLELGMTKNQVRNLLGNNYEVIERYRANEKDIEVLCYQDNLDSSKFYYFIFADGILEEWHREMESRPGKKPERPPLRD